MHILKELILESSTLWHLNYECSHEVILAIDMSNITVGFLLLQKGDNKKCYPSHFSSITLSKVKSHYLQAKLELYGLYCMLYTVCVYIFGIMNLMVKVNAKYIKGMINNPDLQPSTTINQWITGILLFHFNLIHVSAMKHKGIDGLSRRLPTEEDPIEEDDHEDWIDCIYLFGVAILNERMHQIEATGVNTTYLCLSHKLAIMQHIH